MNHDLNRVALRHHQRTLARGAAVLIAVTLLATGCSGGSSSSGSVGGSGSASSGTTKTTNGTKTDADKRLEYTACLRQHGLDIVDPKPGQNGGSSLRLNGSAKSAEAAMAACADKAVGGPAGGQMTQAQKDKYLAFARCMQKNGVNFPDPVFNGGAVQGMVAPTSGPEKEKFAAASKACESIQP